MFSIMAIVKGAERLAWVIYLFTYTSVGLHCLLQAIPKQEACLLLFKIDTFHHLPGWSTS